MKIKIDSTIFKKRMEKLIDIPELTMDKAYPVYRNETPIRSGNARNKTKHIRLKLKSNYPYAGRLDEGWSNQAPKGFTNPTIDFIKKFIRKQVSKV
jgi:hypothetical protein